MYPRPLRPTCALLAVLACPALGHAAPSVSVSSSANLDLSEKDNVEFRRAIAQAAEQGVTDAEARLRRDATASVSVEVSWSDERHADYVGRVVVREGMVVLVDQSFACDACGVGDVLQRVRRETALALTNTRWPAAPAPQTESITTAPPTTSTSVLPTEHTPATDNRTAGLSRMGWAGVGAGAIGVVVAITGAGLWARGDKTTLGPSPEGFAQLEKKVVPYRGIGIGMVVGGLATAAVGGALLYVDTRRSQVAVMPVVGRGVAGASITGRF